MVDDTAVLCGGAEGYWGLFACEDNGLIFNDGGIGSMRVESMSRYALSNGVLEYTGETVSTGDETWEEFNTWQKEHERINDFCRLNDYSLLERECRTPTATDESSEINPGETIQEPSSQEPVTEEKPASNDTPSLYYDTLGLTGLFDDYDWDYMTQDQNWFIKGTGYVSHWLTDAKAKYKTAFRAYIKEFVVENELRNNSSEVTFAEEKEATLEFLESVRKSITDSLNTVGTEAKFADIMGIILEYDDMIKTVNNAKSFTADLDGTFADLIAKTMVFGNETQF